MRCFSFGFARLAQTVMAALLAVALVPVVAQAEIFSLSVQPPNTAEDPDNGDVIRVTAGGTFDTDTGDIITRGSYTIVSGKGRVIERGTWRATELVNFNNDVGGPSPGFQTGILDMNVTLSPKGGDPIFDVPMRIVCNLPGFDTGAPAGTTVGPAGLKVGDFSVPGDEFTLFNLHQSP